MINRQHIHKTAAAVADYKINELIFGDRVLRHNPSEGVQFLTNIQRPIYDFIKSNTIELVLGELTWAHEILTHRMCTQQTELNCKFLNPHVVRIPNNRFAFFTDERQSRILDFGESLETEVILEAKKPDYLAINDKKIKKAHSLVGKIDKLKRFISNENMESNDPTLLNNTRKRVEIKVQEEWNRESYQFVQRTAFSPKEFGNYVFIGLHKQPEASVDVFGRYYENQFQNIINLWRALPQAWNLLIKEHSNAIGDRPKRFYEQLQQLPNVFLVDEKTNSYPIIEHAELVVSVTGTIAYEAALMGVPSVTFAPCFFNRLSTCRQISLEDLAKYKLNEISFQLANQNDNRAAFSDFLLSNSFPGQFYDPITLPAVLENTNVLNISNAIEKAACFLRKSVMTYS